MTDIRERVAEQFDSWADEYDGAMHKAHYFAPDWIRRHVYDLDGIDDCRVLDLACGTGLNVKILKRLREGISAVGVDVSPRMLERAQMRDVYEHLHNLDLNETFPVISSNSFNLVIAFGFIEMLIEPNTCISECSRVLKPGGTLWSSFRLFENRGDISPPRQMSILGINCTGYTAAEINVLIQRHGMSITSIDPVIGYTTEAGFPCPFYVVSSQKEDTSS